MEPMLKNFSEDQDVMKFTLHNIEVCFANALRRTILSDIPTLVIRTENHEINQCNIKHNTSRLHNEIIKQRLSCIPIHSTLLRDNEQQKALPGNYSLILDVENTTENTMYITTEHFRLRDNNDGNVLSKEEMEKLFPGLFPKNVLTQSYIDFVRLRPKIGSDIPGEKLSLVAEFSVATAKDNSMFNVVSKCAYGNTMDSSKASTVWDTIEEKLRKEGETDSDIKFQKENFRLLDAQRHYEPNSFDFVVQTLGVYDNKDLVRKACAIIQNKLLDLIQIIDDGELPVFMSETTMDNCFDIHLENEDYTIGKILEYILYTKFYEGEKTLNFCGFKKFHPHDTKSVIRMAFINKNDKTVINRYVRESCVDAQQVCKDIYQLFK
jgi:DNA-directed RNA polymerase subunit L